jgi:uncharacterized protein YcfL
MKKLFLPLIFSFALSAFGSSGDTPTMRGVIITNEVALSEGLEADNFYYSDDQGGPFAEVRGAVITFHNSGKEAIGNISYRTSYISETGVEHENSMTDAVIEKLIQPGETRTIKLESIYAVVGCREIKLYIKGCDVLSQYTKH